MKNNIVFEVYYLLRLKKINLHEHHNELSRDPSLLAASSDYFHK